jgi:hypothetical protein
MIRDRDCDDAALAIFGCFGALTQSLTSVFFVARPVDFLQIEAPH